MGIDSRKVDEMCKVIREYCAEAIEGSIQAVDKAKELARPTRYDILYQNVNTIVKEYNDSLKVRLEGVFKDWTNGNDVSVPLRQMHAGEAAIQEAKKKINALELDLGVSFKKLSTIQSLSGDTENPNVDSKIFSQIKQVFLSQNQKLEDISWRYSGDSDPIVKRGDTLYRTVRETLREYNTVVGDILENLGKEFEEATKIEKRRVNDEGASAARRSALASSGSGITENARGAFRRASGGQRIASVGSGNGAEGSSDNASVSATGISEKAKLKLENAIKQMMAYPEAVLPVKEFFGVVAEESINSNIGSVVLKGLKTDLASFWDKLDQIYFIKRQEENQESEMEADDAGDQLWKVKS